MLRTCLEGGALAALVAAACLLVPRMRAGHKAALWWLVAAKLLVGLVPIPAFEVAALPAEGASPLVAAVAAGTPIDALREALPAAPRAAEIRWVILAWIAGAVALLACTVPGWLRARDWRRSGRPIDDPGVALCVSRAARAVGLRHEPPVLVVDGLPGPLVTGLLGPSVLLPSEAFTRLAPEELEMTLAHEMAHIARGDLWWGLVPALARRVFFFHPAAWIAEREYAIAREAACDEAVLRPGADAFIYGRLLLRFASHTPASNAIPMSPHSMLRRRLEMIESVVRRVPLTRAGWAFVAAVALTFIPVRLVAKEGTLAFETKASHCLELGGGEDSAYVITNGRSHAMCGDVADVADAVKARGDGPEVIWFRKGDDAFVIRDPAAVREGRRYFDAITEIGLEQSKIGQEQSRIGFEQSRIGAVQAEVAFRDAREAMRRAELEMAQAHKHEGEQAGHADQDAQAAREATGSDLDRMRRVAEEMEVLSQRMQELGERQDRLGEQMTQQMEEVQRAFSAFLDRALKDGRAQRVY